MIFECGEKGDKMREWKEIATSSTNKNNSVFPEKEGCTLELLSLDP